MTTLSPKQKLYLTVGGFLIVFVLIFAIIIIPLIEKIRLSNAAIEEQKMAAEDFYQSWKNMASLKRNYEQIRDEIANQPTFLPKNEALKFIMATEKMAQETGNRQNISATKDSSTTVEATALKLQISLYGSFPNLLKFLVKMENAPYFNRFDSLQINRITAEKDSLDKTGDVNSVINLSAYYQ
ncbi:MAG: hypothetical protein ABIG65_02035 [Patescibacteria group bacterium]